MSHNRNNGSCFWSLNYYFFAGPCSLESCWPGGASATWFRPRTVTLLPALPAPEFGGRAQPSPLTASGLRSRTVLALGCHGHAPGLGTPGVWRRSLGPHRTDLQKHCRPNVHVLSCNSGKKLRFYGVDFFIVFFTICYWGTFQMSCDTYGVGCFEMCHRMSHEKLSTIFFIFSQREGEREKEKHLRFETLSQF